MSEEVVETPSEVVEEVASETPQLSEREIIEKEAIDRYRESVGEKEPQSVVDTDYNEDGTPKEELIGGKFKSQEDLLNAYQELEKKLGQPKEDAPEADASKEEPEAPVNFSTEAYEKEFVENGSLSDKSYEELAAKGFSKEQVDAYIQGQKSYAEVLQNQIYSVAGGKEAYLETINWISVNMSESFIKDYNDAVAVNNQEKITQSLEYAKFKMGESAPRETRRIEGDSPAAGVQPFQDKNEWQRAMTDRLYGKDKKYTQMVDNRYLAARKKGIL